MPVTQHQNPIYNFAPSSKKYRDNYNLIDFRKITHMTEENTNTAVATEVKTVSGKTRGRPKGSKNKKTLEKERLAALESEQATGFSETNVSATNVDDSKSDAEAAEE